MTRDASAARKPTGNTVPSTIGTSPKTSPTPRSPRTRSIPSTSPDRLDAPLEHGEERALFTLVRRKLPGYEADVRRHLGKLLALGRIESRKQRNVPDLLGRHHLASPNGRVIVRPTRPTQ